MDASAFAFLQKLMGQEFSRGGNFITPEQLLVSNPTAQQVAALQASYDDVKNYMQARFLAQAAYSIIADEGENADLGSLAPFMHITFNPFTVDEEYQRCHHVGHIIAGTELLDAGTTNTRIIQLHQITQCHVLQ